MTDIDIKNDFLGIISRWMKSDIEKMLNHGLNFPLALCILSYMDFLGSILLGKDMENYKNGEEYIKECFNKKIQSEYPVDVVREVFRNALAHEYFARGGISKSGVRPAIRKDNYGRLILDAKTLAQDFLESLNEFKILVEKDTKGSLVSRLVEMNNSLKEKEKKYGHKFQPYVYNQSASMTVAGAIVEKSYTPEAVSALNIGVINRKNNVIEKVKKMKIGIVGSMQYTEKMIEARDELIKLGHEAFLTTLANPFIGKNDEEKEKIKLNQKYNLDAIREFWRLMQNGDAILVLNFDKNGVKNYIGGNTLMEIGFAHVLNQKVFLYNPIPDIPYYKSEIEAVKPVVINGDLNKIK